MGDFTFERGNLNSIPLMVLRLSGTTPNFPADYTAPTVRISHMNGNTEVEDLAPVAMNQVGSTNRWFHNFTVPNNAPFTRYLVTFQTTIEGVLTTATEEFKVNPAVVSGGGGGGTGTFPVTITLKNSANLQPMAGVAVTVYDAGSPSTPLASVLTDANGDATVFLNTGNYLVEFKKSGVISEIHNLSVDALGNHELDGD